MIEYIENHRGKAPEKNAHPIDQVRFFSNVLDDVQSIDELLDRIIVVGEINY